MIEGHNLWTVEDIAKLLKQHPRHVRSRVTRRPDFPPCIVIGGALRWRETDVKEWIDAQATKRPPEKKPPKAEAHK